MQIAVFLPAVYDAIFQIVFRYAEGANSCPGQKKCMADNLNIKNILVI